MSCLQGASDRQHWGQCLTAWKCPWEMLSRGGVCRIRAVRAGFLEEVASELDLESRIGAGQGEELMLSNYGAGEDS